MFGQCLSNKNKSATVAKNQSFCQLNKALYSCHADGAYATGGDSVERTPSRPAPQVE